MKKASSLYQGLSWKQAKYKNGVFLFPIIDKHILSYTVNNYLNGIVYFDGVRIDLHNQSYDNFSKTLKDIIKKKKTVRINPFMNLIIDNAFASMGEHLGAITVNAYGAVSVNLCHGGAEAFGKCAYAKEKEKIQKALVATLSQELELSNRQCEDERDGLKTNNSEDLIVLNEDVENVVNLLVDNVKDSKANHGNIINQLLHKQVNSKSFQSGERTSGYDSCADFKSKVFGEQEDSPKLKELKAELEEAKNVSISMWDIAKQYRDSGAGLAAKKKASSDEVARIQELIVAEREKSKDDMGKVCDQVDKLSLCMSEVKSVSKHRVDSRVWTGKTIVRNKAVLKSLSPASVGR